MALDRSLQELVTITRCVVRVSEALFGYVFELAPDHSNFVRGCPVAGSIREEEVVRSYFKPIGQRALELLRQGQDQAVLVETMHDTEHKHAWFAVILTQSLGPAACVAIVYPFYDRDESVRILHLVEMIMTRERLR